MTSHAEYLTNLIDPVERDKVLSWMDRSIKVADGHFPFDGFMGGGVSGHMASILSFKYDKGLGIARQTRSHSPLVFEGSLGMRNVAIVDDLVNTGNTLKSLMKTATANGLDVEGIILYNQGWAFDSDDLKLWKGHAKELGHDLKFVVDNKGGFLLQ